MLNDPRAFEHFFGSIASPAQHGGDEPGTARSPGKALVVSSSARSDQRSSSCWCDSTCRTRCSDGCLRSDRSHVRAELVPSGWSSSAADGACQQCCEGMNSVIRMHQAASPHPHATVVGSQTAVLELSSVSRRQTSRQRPLQAPGLKLPTYDFWELLNMDPQDLTQILSTPKVAP